MKDSDIRIYQLEDGKTEINVQLDNDTVWLNLNQITDLFGRDKSVISRHIRNVFKVEELQKSSVVAKNATTALDGKTYPPLLVRDRTAVQHYSRQYLTSPTFHPVIKTYQLPGSGREIVLNNTNSTK